MRSPFPGMDPYVQQFWRDMHHRLITYAHDDLQPRLPKRLRARVEERVFVESEGGQYRPISTDVYVIEYPKPRPAATAPDGGVALELAVEEPLLIHLRDEPVSQGYLEIIDAASGKRVVTVIEFVSPSNKVAGDGMRLYVEKQQEVIAAGASLVEIDLTRGGQDVLAVPLWRLPPSRRTLFRACVRRGWKPDLAEVYPLPLRKRLPAIRIPLRETDKDVPLDLQALIDECYEKGGYHDDLNYRVEPVPALDPDDAAWADELLRSRGLR